MTSPETSPGHVKALSDCGGGVEQTTRPVSSSALVAPSSVIANQKTGTAAGYKAASKKDGIPFRPHGLFTQDDAVLQKLDADPNCWPFEKHLPGPDSPYQLLKQGGWITGTQAAKRGIDLRLFYCEPSSSSSAVDGPGARGDNGTQQQERGKLLGALRFGDGAAIGTGPFYLSAHGGAIETVLDEATAELAKVEFQPFVSTREATFSIKRPVPLNESLLVECIVTEVKGLRCWVEGHIKSADGVHVLASCNAQLVDMRPFIDKSGQ